MSAPPVTSPMDCVSELKRLRIRRELADVQREIDRVQAKGAAASNSEIDVLLRKKNDLGFRIEQLK
jgi:hypothetical protein